MEGVEGGDVLWRGERFDVVADSDVVERSKVSESRCETVESLRRTSASNPI